MTISAIAHPFADPSSSNLFFSSFSNLIDMIVRDVSEKLQFDLDADHCQFTLSSIENSRFVQMQWGPELGVFIEFLADPNSLSRTRAHAALQNYCVKNTTTNGEYEINCGDEPGSIYPFFHCLFFEVGTQIRVERSDGFLKAYDQDDRQINVDGFGSIATPIDTAIYSTDIVDPENLYLLKKSAVESNASLIWPQVLSLFECHPQYEIWVARVLQTILIMRPEDGSFRTGGWEKLAGVIYLDDCMDVYLIAESLVHEAAHQYFYLGEMLVEFSDDDENQFHSPAVGEMRSLREILLAFHAFGNVVVFYDRVRTRDENLKCRNFARNLELTLALGEILDQNCGLTIEGKHLFECLKFQLRTVTPKYIS